MKIQTWIVGVAILAMQAAPATAEINVDSWTTDDLVTAVGCDDCCDSGCCGDDCCDSGCCGDDCCGSGCDGCGCGDGVGGLAGFTLAGLLGLDDSGWDFGGWTQVGWHDNNVPLSQAFDDGLAFNDLPDQVNLHQQWFYLGKEADGSNGFDWGFRADVMYGTDAQKTQAFGNPGAGTRGFGTFDASLDHGEYGWAIPQLYAEVAMGDLSVIVGHFFTLVGYEVVPATGNFFYSHALTMFNTEPFTHTGVLTTYNGFDNITLYNGWTTGWDTGFDSVNSGSSYLGGIGFEVSDNLSVTYISTYGNFGARDGGDDNSYSHSVVAQAGLTDNLQYIFQTDYLRTTNPGVTVEDDFGINQYLILGLNDVFALGTRMEWWKDEGTSHYALTGGVNVQILDNLIWRPEYRQSWSPASDYDEDTFGMDMILTY